MKKTENKITTIEFIIMVLAVIASVVGAIVIGMWIYHGIANVVETYQQVGVLTHDISRLEKDNEEIIKKVCGQKHSKYYIMDGTCIPYPTASGEIFFVGQSGTIDCDNPLNKDVCDDFKKSYNK